MRELLLCPPDHYGIEYEINPWMSRARGADAPVAQQQWKGLHETLSKLDSKIHLVPPQPRLPDMVFTANAGLRWEEIHPEQFSPQRTRRRSAALRQMDGRTRLRNRVVTGEIFISRAKATRSSAATRFFAATNSVPTFNLTAPWPTCSVVSLSRWSLSILAFIIWTLAFVRCRTAARFWFPAAFDEYGQRAIREHVERS